MRFDTTLQQRLQQRMVLAPRMIQAMEILQLPLMALQERIDQELIANPVIEMREVSPDEEAAEPRSEDQAPADIAETERELVVRDDDSNAEDFERLSNLVDRWETYFEETGGRRRVPYDAGEDPKSEAMQNTPDDGETLQELMLRQWHLEEHDEPTAALGELVIRNLDDNG